VPILVLPVDVGLDRIARQWAAPDLPELEVPAEKGFGGLEHLLLHRAAAEAMAFAGKQVHLHRYTPFSQG
jgi:hypothetical protein